MATHQRPRASDSSETSLQINGEETPATADSSTAKKLRGRCCCCCCSLTWKKFVFLMLCSVTVIYLIFVGPSGNSRKRPLLTLCFSVERIVYIKTHKTASTTLSSILQRWGYVNNINFALPHTGHTFSMTQPFNRGMVKLLPSKRYGMLTNHARYYRPEMETLVPGAVYVTILREPSSQLESAFGFYKMAEKLRISHHRNPFEKFMEDPGRYLSSRRDFNLWTQMRNGQIFDLGLDHRFHDNDSIVDAKIRDLDKEFHVVLITEHFDESLLVLKNILCWKMNDILYLSNSIRGRTLHYRMSDDLVEKTREWNSADAKLYAHFNESLWDKISDYGPNFQADLAKFRKELQLVKKQCILPNRYRALANFREERLVLKPGASTFCKQLWFGDMEYTDLIRDKQRPQSWLPPQQFGHGQPYAASANRRVSGTVFVWVWILVWGGVAWCLLSCCAAAACCRRDEDEQASSFYEDDDDDYCDLNDQIERELELRRKYLALVENARPLDRAPSEGDRRVYKYKESHIGVKYR